MKLNHLAILGTTSLFVSSLCLSGYASEKVNTHFRQSGTNIIAEIQQFTSIMGNFMAAEKPTTGKAKIVKEGNHYYLELDSSFSTSDQGPDLHVLLDPSNQPPKTYTNINQAVNLGRLQKYNGQQRYPIPDAINPNQFHSVVIWCRMANATFGYAPLQMQKQASL